MSRNEQFNRQYEETIESVKSLAIWRVGDKVREAEAFRCHCPNCGYESLHQRFDLTRHRLVFGRSIRAIEAPRPMLRCRRCGDQRHLRDVGELVVPSTIEMHDRLRELLVAELQQVANPSVPDVELPTELREQLAAFRNEASGPVRLHLLTAVASSELLDGAGRNRRHIEAVGRELYLTSSQIDSVFDREQEPPGGAD